MNKDNHLIAEAYFNRGNEEEINLKKADLNKDNKLNDYELARAKAIDKAMGGSGEKPESEDAEDMSKSPFHYDPMHGLARAAHQIKDALQSAANDEATTEHIEKMAEIVLGPQSEYESYEQYERVLKGVMELLNHYVVVPMN